MEKDQWLNPDFILRCWWPVYKPYVSALALQPLLFKNNLSSVNLLTISSSLVLQMAPMVALDKMAVLVQPEAPAKMVGEVVMEGRE